MNDEIKTRQVDQVFEDGKVIYYFAFLVYGLFTLQIYNLVEVYQLVIWTVGFNAAIVLRGFTLYQYKYRRNFNLSTNQWMQLHIFNSFLYGSALAYLILLFDNSWPVNIQLGFWMMVFGLIAVIIKGLSSVYLTYLAVTLPMQIAALVALTLSGTPPIHNLILIHLVYSIGVHVTAYSAYLTNRQRIKNELSQNKMNEKLQLIASRDALTNLSNRRGFDNYFKSEWERNRRSASVLSLLVIDVDYFKQYNDTYGHAAGDDCLIRIANGVNKCLKRPADRAARYGGEEFTVLLPDTPMQGALEVAERILHVVRSLNIEHKSSSVSKVITVSIGLATIDPGEAETHDILFEMADHAMYTAKTNGRNQISRFVPDSVMPELKTELD